MADGAVAALDAGVLLKLAGLDLQLSLRVDGAIKN